MYTQWPYLWYLSVELRHIISQQSAKFSKRLLMPRIIFQRHFALHFCVINHNRAKLTTSVRRIERCTCLPVMLKSLSVIHPCDAVRVPRCTVIITLHKACYAVSVVGHPHYYSCHILCQQKQAFYDTMLTYLGK